MAKTNLSFLSTEQVGNAVETSHEIVRVECPVGRVNIYHAGEIVAVKRSRIWDSTPTTIEQDNTFLGRKSQRIACA
jgi:hypothetical protein